MIPLGSIEGTVVGVSIVVFGLWLGFALAVASYGDRKGFPFFPLLVSAVLLSPPLVLLGIAIGVGVRDGHSGPKTFTGHMAPSSTPMPPPTASQSSFGRRF